MEKEKSVPNNKLTKTIPILSIWKTIKLGDYKHIDDLLASITQSGMTVGEWGNHLLTRPDFNLHHELVEIPLVQVNIDELPLREDMYLNDIYSAVIGKSITINDTEYEIALCPNEVGPQLRLQYTDQPKDELLRIAMDPIKDSVGSIALFRVENVKSNMLLSGILAESEKLSKGNFIFCLQKK